VFTSSGSQFDPVVVGRDLNANVPANLNKGSDK
jgi:hypothetical protein